MATELALAKRRNEAYARIGVASATLAKGHRLHLANAAEVRHRDPGIEQTLRIEALADNLEAIVKEHAKTAKVPTLADNLQTVEAELEAETGHDVVKTGDDPPSFVETDKPKPKVPRK
jgi:hypothetical protein